MNRNSLYALIALLAVVIVGLGIYVYHEESKPKGVEIQIDKNGLSVEKN